MEKGIRVRVEYRAVPLPPSTAAPTVIRVNCWRLQILYGVTPPVINGVNFLSLFQSGFNALSPLVLGGVYDSQGFPVYLNQTFTVRSSIAAPPAGEGLLLIEEYIDHNARQNR
jgi:hypothetical protein